MTAVEIKYCHPCGLLGRAEDVQHALLTTFGTELEGVTLTTGTDGIFVVRVDDETVFDKATATYDVDEIVRRIREEL